MEKEFSYTPMECDYHKLCQLLDETKYRKLDVYFKQNDAVYHIVMKLCDDQSKSDYEYLINDDKYYSFLELKEKLDSLINAEEVLEILEIDGDGPHYHNVFSKGFIDIEREEIVTDFVVGENNVESSLVATFKNPKHTWIMLENFIYLIVIIFALVYGLSSLFSFGADFFNVALLVLAFIMTIYCFKDYLKYKLEIYNDKIVYPHIDVNDFNTNFKNYREIKFKDVKKVIYLNNPKSGKTGRELVVICEDGSQRVISLNIMNKNQYIDIACCLIDNINLYHNSNQ